MLRKLTLEKALPYIILVVSIIGLISAFALTYDKIQVLKNPNYIPSCNINPVLSCGSVMEKPQATVFGVPNTIFGLMGFSASATVAALMIMGVKMNRRVWQGVQVGATAGLAFIIYLFVEGVFRINAICPFCFAIWLTLPVMFWYTTFYTLRKNYLPMPGVLSHVRAFVLKHEIDLVVLWYIVFFGILLQHFWYYWSTLL